MGRINYSSLFNRSIRLMALIQRKMFPYVLNQHGKWLLLYQLTVNSNLSPGQGMGFGIKNSQSWERANINELKSRFRPEFLNRIDEHIVLRSLDDGDVSKILPP